MPTEIKAGDLVYPTSLSAFVEIELFLNRLYMSTVTREPIPLPEMENMAPILIVYVDEDDSRGRKRNVAVGKLEYMRGFNLLLLDTQHLRVVGRHKSVDAKVIEGAFRKEKRND